MLEIGNHLGPYKILSRLGAGGMGEVYRAKDTKLERLVAVKVLAEQLANDPQALARFDREAKAVAALKDTFKVESIAPGHCTGEPTFAALKKAFALGW